MEMLTGARKKKKVDESQNKRNQMTLKENFEPR